jgi:hypothetical protein
METDFILQYKEKSKVKSQKSKKRDHSKSKVKNQKGDGVKAKKSKPEGFDF